MFTKDILNNLLHVTLSDANAEKIIDAEHTLVSYITDVMLPLMYKIVPFCVGTVGNTSKEYHVVLPRTVDFGSNSLCDTRFMISLKGEILYDSIPLNLPKNFDIVEPTLNRKLSQAITSFYANDEIEDIARDLDLTDSDYARQIISAIMNVMSGFAIPKDHPEGIVAIDCTIPHVRLVNLSDIDGITQDALTTTICELYAFKLANLKVLHDSIKPRIVTRLCVAWSAFGAQPNRKDLSSKSLDELIAIGNTLLAIHKTRCEQAEYSARQLMQSLIPFDNVIQRHDEIIQQHISSPVSTLSYIAVEFEDIKLNGVDVKVAIRVYNAYLPDDEPLVRNPCTPLSVTIDIYHKGMRLTDIAYTNMTSVESHDWSKPDISTSEDSYTYNIGTTYINDLPTIIQSFVATQSIIPIITEKFDQHLATLPIIASPF